jgi:hypothetical protein
VAKAKRTKKIRTAEQRAAQTAREIGVPEAQIARGGLVEEDVVDLASRRSIGRTVRRLYPSLVDRWFAEGGMGFEEPQKRAVDHVRRLWHAIGGQGRLVANLGSPGGGSGPRRRFWEHADVVAQLAEYQRDVPADYWQVFENVIRFDMPAGRAGSHLDRHAASRIAAARAVVGLVASTIARRQGG